MNLLRDLIAVILLPYALLAFVEWEYAPNEWSMWTRGAFALYVFLTWVLVIYARARGGKPGGG